MRNSDWSSDVCSSDLQRLNGYRLKEADGKQWADLARRLISQRDPTARQHDFRLAMELLDAIGASEYVAASSVLPQALDDRLAKLGDALTRFLRSSEALPEVVRSEEHTSELQSLMRSPYAVFCLKNKKK